MSSWRVGLITILALTIAAACEPQNVAVVPTARPATATVAPASAAPSVVPGSAATGSSATGTSATGTSAPSAAPATAGVATITTAATGVHITAIGPVLKTGIFDLAGNSAMKLSKCGSTGVFPFVWVYTEFNAQIGQYVEEVSHIKMAKGRYYLHVVSPPDCTWTIDFSPD